MFLDLPDLEFICMDPDPSVKIEEKPIFLLFCDFFMTFLFLKNDVNVGYIQKGLSIKT
jgi:hypothetical protein